MYSSKIAKITISSQNKIEKYNFETVEMLGIKYLTDNKYYK